MITSSHYDDIVQDLRTLRAAKDWSEIERHMILLGYRGSMAHGMYIPAEDPNSIDDTDLMAVCVPDLGYYWSFGTFGSRDTIEVQENHWDVVAYEARKFIDLLAKGNPNVLSLLWLDPVQDLLVTTGAGTFLIDNRRVFVGKHVYDSFVGYAHGQLKRMTHHAHQGYMGAKRKALVEQFGFDCKNAAHLIRLLRMAIEFLMTGDLTVRRPDADQLLEIKRGEWSLERVKDEADRLFKDAEEAHRVSKLPERPSQVGVYEICGEVVFRALADRGRLNRLSAQVVKHHLLPGERAW